jgi:hypothetical protein
MGSQAGVAEHAPRVRPRRGFVWGLTAGLVLNAVVFAVIFAMPWVERHVYEWLALGVLYAGPVVVGLAGLVQMFSARSRRRGAGLILAALITVALWYVIVYVDTLISLSANTPD